MLTIRFFSDIITLVADEDMETTAQTGVILQECRGGQQKPRKGFRRQAVKKT